MLYRVHYYDRAPAMRSIVVRSRTPEEAIALVRNSGPDRRRIVEANPFNTSALIPVHEDNVLRVPPVCEGCEVVFCCDPADRKSWSCPVCGETKFKLTLLQYKRPTQDRINQNTETYFRLRVRERLRKGQND